MIFPGVFKKAQEDELEVYGSRDGHEIIYPRFGHNIFRKALVLPEPMGYSATAERMFGYFGPLHIEIWNGKGEVVSQAYARNMLYAMIVARMLIRKAKRGITTAWIARYGVPF